MPLRILLGIFSILGIVAIFFPWLYFPKSNMSFYGYKADGVVTGFLFFVTLISTLLTIKRYKLSNILLSVFGFIGLLLAYITYRKLVAMDFERENFGHENVLVVEALAGTQLGIGVYMSGVAGLGVFLTALGIFVEQYLYKKSATIKSGVKLYNRVLLISFVTIAIGCLANFQLRNTTIDENMIKTNIASNVESMGKTLSQEKYEDFIAFNHPLMVNSTGGKAKMIQLIKQAMAALNENGSTVKTINVKSISQIVQNGTNIQALLTQVVIYDTNGIETSEEQNMLAVSEDKGRNFKFINITKKSKQDIIKFFPGLNQKLNF